MVTHLKAKNLISSGSVEMPTKI